eukprot:m.67335 g.67335  ORF g.67335 m.67335 type:complete len:460 (+) comp8429_c0_seq1:338-1717(+)
MDALLAAAEADESGDEAFGPDDELEQQLNEYSPDELFDELEGSGGPGGKSADTAMGAAKAGVKGETVDGERPTSTSVVDDGALRCKITEFFPMDNKMVYRIACTTTLPGYKKKEFEVLRKYEDFMWLHDRLTENRDLAGVLIPHLPPKVTWVSPEPGQIAQKVSYNDGLNVKLTDQFQRRAHQLHRFLRRVCRHELLRKDIHVVVFLEFQEDLKPINKKSWFATPWYTMKKVDDEEAIEIRAWANKYAVQLALAAPAAESMTLASRGLATVEIELMHELKAWTGHPEVVKVFRHFSTGLVRSQINHHLRAQVEETLIELLEDYMGTVAATKGMINRVNALTAELDDIVKQRKKLTVAIFPAGDPRADKQRKKLERINEMYAESKELVSDARHNRTREVALAQKRRAGDFKEAFIALAEHEIHQGKQRIQTWEEIAREIRMVEEKGAAPVAGVAASPLRA